MNRAPIPDLLVPVDAAALLNVQPGTLAIWRNRGTGPAYVKVGRSVRYPRADLLEWIELNTVRPAS